MAQETPLIVLYDAECGLCDRGVRFIHRRDRRGRFRYAALQGERGRGLLRAHGLPGEGLETMVLIEEGRAYVRSTAVLRIARRLGPGWSLLYALRLVPRPLRDAAYAAVARRRHRLFPKDQCGPLPPGLAARMLDGKE